MRHGTSLGAYSLTELPGCPQVCVSHGAFLRKKHRGRGYGDYEHTQRLNEVKKLGYDLAICTVVSTNEAQKHILQKNGWHFCISFLSSNTGHVVELWARGIDQP